MRRSLQRSVRTFWRVPYRHLGVMPMPIWLRVLGQAGHSRVAPRAVNMYCVGKRSHLAFERMLTGDSPHGERDHSKAQPAIREILSSLGLSSSGLRWIASYSHSAWMTDEVVVRYRTFGPTGRLSHETCVAALLPAEVLYPTVIAQGCDGDNDWLVTERIAGESLYAMWPRLSVRERETATHEMAIAVRALHGSPAQHLQPPCLYGGAPVIARAKFIDTLSDVVRSAADAAEPAEVHRCLELLDSCRSAIDDPPAVMAHHDLNFSQCIWRDGHLVGLVDLEMSHANSADWDLVELLGMCADPRRRANTAATGEHVLPAQFDRVAYWFHEVYPAPFEHPALRQRLRVYELVHRLAELSQRPDARRSIVSTLELGTSYEHLLPQ